MKSSTLSIYGCGGCGANIVQRYVNLPVVEDRPIFPKSRRYVVDTSASNIRHMDDDINVFLIPGVEGAGKKRDFAYGAAVDKVDKILQDNKPSEFNLVIFSAAGGSGSVLGPLLASELLKRDAATLCIVVGSTLSHKECHNTIATLRTLQGLCKNSTNGHSITMAYFENSTSGAPGQSHVLERPDVDLRIEEVIRQTGLLVGGSHHGLDAADLRNWLGFSKHTGIPAQLTEALVFRQGEDGIRNGRTEIKSMNGVVQALCSLMGSESVQQPALAQPYSCEGYYTTDMDLPDLHYAITASRLPIIMGALNAKMDELNEVKEQLSTANLAVEAGESDDGFTF